MRQVTSRLRPGNPGAIVSAVSGMPGDRNAHVPQTMPFCGLSH